MMLSTKPPTEASILPSRAASDLAARAMASKTYSDEMRLVLAGWRLAFVLVRMSTMSPPCCGANCLAMSLSSPTLVPDRRGARTVLSSRSSKACEVSSGQKELAETAHPNGICIERLVCTYLQVDHDGEL